MRVFDAVRLRLRSLVRSTLVEQELDEELRFHVEEHVTELMARGLSRADARMTALRAFGGVDQIKERVRDTWRVRLIRDVGQDLRYAARTLARAPAFTIVAALTIALGVGATTAIFSAVDGVLLKPLHYPDSDRIVRVLTHWTKTGHDGENLAGGDLVDVRTTAGIFEAFSAFNGGELGVTAGGRAELVGTYYVNTTFFRVFGVRPFAGRSFRTEDIGTAAVVSWRYAAQRFGSPAAALGQTISVEAITYQIVGVMPPGFHFPQIAEVWIPMGDRPGNMNRSGHNYPVTARLRAGTTREGVDAAMATVSRRLARSFPDTNKDKTLIAMPLQDQLVGPMRGTLYLLLGAVALLFLIACANVANLLLARATVRSRELALRAALGANRWRIVRQLLVEHMLVAAFGGCAGLVLAFAGTEWLVHLAPIDLPRVDEIGVNRTVLGFSAVISVLASLVFGLTPAWSASRVDLRARLVEGGAHGSIGAASNRLRTGLAIGEIALAVVLAVAGGLLFRSFVALSTVDLGYRTSNVIAVQASVPAANDLAAKQKAVDRLGRVASALLAIPGVEAASATVGLPLGSYMSNGSFAVEGRHTFGPGQDLPAANFRFTMPGYFATMGVPLRRGRDFTSRDGYDAPFVTIVSEALARQVFPNEDPIGRRIQCGFDSMKFMTVVGIAGDIRESPGTPPTAELYMPVAQHPMAGSQVDLVIRTATPPLALVETLRGRMRQIDPAIAAKYTLLGTRAKNAVATPRFRTWLVGTFAALALLLALAGVYGLLTYLTAQRTPELGIRMALGARRGSVIALVLSRAALIAGVGLALGVTLSLLASRAMATMIFGIEVLDPLTYAVVSSAVLVVTIVAAAVPAWRASRIDPLSVLRQQ
jgi:putative ABC transport system permease protein